MHMMYMYNILHMMLALYQQDLHDGAIGAAPQGRRIYPFGFLEYQILNTDTEYNYKYQILNTNTMPIPNIKYQTLTTK